MFTKKTSTIMVLFLLVVVPGLAVYFFHFNINLWFLYLLVGIIFIFALWSYIQIIYLIFLTWFGFKKPKKDYAMVSDQTKFLIFIPAHNEEDVIYSTLNNLQNIDYKEELYKIVVISDNSTDKTSEIVRASGVADLIEPNEEDFGFLGVGKTKALQYSYLFLKRNQVLENYDMLVVLDADNYVSPNILKELNSQFIQKNKPEAIQVYLDSKNYDNLLSLGYSVSYWTMNRFFQLAKYRLGLPNSIGGTGFAVNTRWLENHEGFYSTSLTEDLEMEIRIVESGGRILWNHFAHILDEKPERLKDSMIQRYRWSKGHWFVAFTYWKRMVFSFCKKPHFKYIDQLLYLFSMNSNFQVLIAIALFMSWLLQKLLSLETFNNYTLYWSKAYIFPVSLMNYFFLIYGLVPIFMGFILDEKYGTCGIGKRILQIVKVNIAFLWFSATYGVCQIWGLFNCREQKNWNKTAHAINFNEVSELD